MPFPPPPAIGGGVPVNQLPLCTAVKADALTTAHSGAGLGWTGTWRVGVINGTQNYEHAMLIPCTGATGTTVEIAHTFRRFAGNGNAFSPRGGWTDLKLTCSNGVTTNTITSAGASDTGLGYGGVEPEPVGGSPANWSDFATAAGACTYLIEVRITLYNVVGGASAIAGVAIWKPSNWVSGDGGWVPGGTIPTGLELPIVCTLDNSGADIFEITRNVIGSLVAWPGCMLIPVGWDRAGKIAAEWNNGAIAELTDAYDAVVPSGLSCGVVVSIPFGPGIVLNTCNVDMAPEFVKVILGWVIVLGLCGLAVYRLFWVVGSKG